ncbi:ABC transporter permease [Parapedobacter lycopersici]|uniref:ABC transporter permease n=1 Tax=Parapedobacter lycopersici TaxID=1864939 RepID=UPI003341F9C4
MIKNYLKIAWRSIVKNKFYTVINVIGLSLSIATALVIFCIIRFEASFDHYHRASDRLYKVMSHDVFGELNSHIPQGLMKALRQQFPEIEKAATVYRFDPSVIRAGEQNFKAENSYFVHPEFFDMIDVEWVKGSPDVSLTQPYQVVLDEPTALRLFNGDAMGKTIRYDNKFDVTVSGIIKAVPPNSDFQLRFIFSHETLAKYMPEMANADYWDGGDSWHQGYVLLKPGVNPTDIESGINKLIQSYLADNKTHYKSFTLLPFSAIHFDTITDIFNYATPGWLLYVLGGAAVLLLLIACINYINIAMAQAMLRDKETGIRKVLGGTRWQIVASFMVETAVIVSISLIVGVFLANAMLPYSGQLLNTQVSLADNWDIGAILFIGCTALSLCVVAGGYPGWMLAHFSPAKLLRTTLFVPRAGGFALRKVLLVSQFIIAQLLIICTIIGIRQVNYLYDKELGFDKTGIMAVNMPNAEHVFRERLRNNLLQHTEIKEVTFGLTTPSSIHNWWWGQVKYPGLIHGEQQFRQQFVDTNYFKFFNIALIAGRNFNQADTTRAVAMINEKAAHEMGHLNASAAIGNRIEMWGDTYEVTGVVDNYISQSLKEDITPHIYFYNGRFFTAMIRIAPAERSEAIVAIREEWKSIFPDNFFEYRFLDDELKTFYSGENKFAGMLSLFTVISVITSCLGIFGLVSFICRRKTKEIGIRKVLGASVVHIVRMLVSDFMKLIAVAILIASPIAWWAMNKWLTEYTYRVDIAWWIFAIAGLIAVVTVTITVSFQTIRAAVANPVDSLRDE